MINIYQNITGSTLNYNKIHIIGGPCTGKSYILDKLVNSDMDGNIYSTLSLDDIFWKSDVDTFGIKENVDIRDKKLFDFLNNNYRYIVEGSYINEWIKPSLDRADMIFVLILEYDIVEKRILERFYKRKCGVEKSSKIETEQSINDLLLWAKTYPNKLNNSINDGILSRYTDKIVFLNDNMEICQYLV